MAIYSIRPPDNTKGGDMHEIAIAETICKTIEREASSRGMEALKSARLKIGKMNAFNLGNLELCLAGLKEKKLFTNLKFEIQEVPVELSCDDCQEKFTDSRFDDYDFAHKIAHAPAFYESPACPVCGSKKIKMISGNEIEIVSIED